MANEKTYKVKFAIENKYVAEDVTKGKLVKVIAAKGDNFEPTIVSDLPATGDSSKLYLTPKAHTTQTATGNPVTATVAEQAGKLESFQLDGDTYQQTYTGKNLFIGQNYEQGYLGDRGAVDPSNTSVTCVDYIPVNAGTHYQVSLVVVANGSMARGVAFYDTDKTFISRLIGNDFTGGFTAPNNAAFARLYFYNANGMSVSDFPSSFMTDIQLEVGSSASSFEPYVGGQPSPSPEFPQQIQTVTGNQTVRVIGKNLFNKNAVTNGGYINTNGEVVPWETFGYSEYIRVIGGQTYSYSGTANNVGYSAKAAWYDSNKNFISAFSFGQSGQVTAPATAKFLRTSVRIASPSGLDTYQLELGSTITTYEAYKATNYPLDLGSIELNGLGDDGNGNPLYKDRIYRDGEEWKVHKATGEYTLTGDEAWSSGGAGNHTCYTTAITDYAASNNVPYSQYFRGVSNVNGAGTMGGKPDNTIAFIDQSTTVRFYIRSTKFENDASALKTWLSAHNTDVYYALATPTDTTITDTTLIAQLEAIRTASLQNGVNTITNTATGSNLAGDMEIGYYGCNPTNRYDKWIWLSFDNSYEQLNNPEPTATLSSTRSLSTTTEQTTPTRSVETATLKKGASDTVGEKTELDPVEEQEEIEEKADVPVEEQEGIEEKTDVPVDRDIEETRPTEADEKAES